MAIAAVLAMAVARDQIEARLRKLAAFVQLHPNPAMELDAEAKITYANEAAHKLAALVGRAHPRSCCRRTSATGCRSAWPRDRACRGTSARSGARPGVVLPPGCREPDRPLLWWRTLPAG